MEQQTADKLFLDLEIVHPKLEAQAEAIEEFLGPDDARESWLLGTLQDQLRDLGRIVEGMRVCRRSVNGNGAGKSPGLAERTSTLQDQFSELETQLGLLDQVIFGLQAEAKINEMDEDDFEPSRFLIAEIRDRAGNVSVAIQSVTDGARQVSVPPAGSRQIPARQVDVVAPLGPQTGQPNPVLPSERGKRKGGDVRKSVATLKKRSAHSNAKGKGGRRASAAA